jgi:hypothetical protein
MLQQTESTSRPEKEREFYPHLYTPKYIIDPQIICSYNVIMKIKFAGFFRPDHDPPQRLRMPVFR